ncbi:pleckstrin homology domain-containing family S member 1 isoform X1 [Bufo bufo]|uniref:pleckstrin homology domain-containing family S member 1 isoform X1 n=2 Tax=Bufo bufo TaxID=8384 RepID=UPI001ABEE5A5|nr:pleckstrin homology domain-containing family S member 1 isoform X1 [Bufo bufo]
MAASRSWFTMGPRRRSSETDEQIIKQGRLIKSPPSYVFNNKASWKWRLLKLCRTAVNSFILRYYAYDSLNEEWKGDIHISDVKSIEVGRSTMERIATITRLFNNCPENILCVRTDKRDFYLVDGSVENIAEWQKYLTDAWIKIHQKVQIEGPTRTSAGPLAVIPAQEVMRPKSYPTDYPRTETLLVEDLNMKRCHTEGWRGNRSTPNNYREYKDVISEEQYSNTLPVYSQTPSGEYQQLQEVRRHSAAASPQDDPERRRFSDDMTDPAYGSEQESIYDTPRSIPRKMSQSQESQKEMEAEEESGEEEEESGEEEEESGEEEETSDLGSEEVGVYEQMSSLVIGEVAHVPLKPPRKFKPSPRTRNFKSKRSQLKRAQLLRMVYEQSSGSDLVPVTVMVPTEHLQKYLGLQEVGDRLCVSKWKGPLHIGCLFHHGDHIESINGFRSGSKDFFFQMLSQCISEEVSLVLKRNIKADVFHLEGCNCESP